MRSYSAAGLRSIKTAYVLSERFLGSSFWALYHSLKYLTTTYQDVVIKNPNFIQPQTTDKKLKKGIAIYFIHGTADNAKSFSGICHALRGCLPSAVSAMHMIAFDGRFKGKNIRHFSQQLHDRIIANGDEQVILVGHSRGACVVSDAAISLLAPSKISALITVGICGPYKGAVAANRYLAYFSDSVGEMLQGSTFLKALHAAKKSHHKHICIGAADDYVVSPKDANFDDTPLIEIEDCGHLSILYKESLLQVLIKNIFDTVKQIYPEVTEKEIQSDFYSIESTNIPRLWDMSYEINSHIDYLSSCQHFFSADKKIAVFQRLSKLVNHIIDTGSKDCAEEKTVDDLIEKFLTDKSVADEIPKQVIDARLNPSLLNAIGLTSEPTTSRKFINKLKQSYGGLALRECLVEEKEIEHQFTL